MLAEKGEKVMKKDIVYVYLFSEHFKEDTSWKCNSEQEAKSLQKWLKRFVEFPMLVSEETWDQLPDKICGYKEIRKYIRAQ